MLKLIELLSKWSKDIPYFFHMISAFIGILLFATIIIVIQRLRKADVLEIPWLSIKISPDQKYIQLKSTHDRINKQFIELNEDARQKNNILKLINSVNEEIAILLRISQYTEFVKKRDLLYNFILTGIIGAITKAKDNYHRVAVFIPCDNSENLKIYKSQGHSPSGQEKLRLSINESVAGYVYRCKNPILINELDGHPLYRPNEKSSRRYQSLICVPVMTDGDIWGVLSLDGEKSASFSEDDRDFLKYFAMQLAIIFQLEEYHETLRLASLERRYDHGLQEVSGTGNVS